MTVETNTLLIRCPRCDEPMHEGVVKTAIWERDRLYVVEDVPAMVCNRCMEQYYDDNVVHALRRLSEEGFPTEEAKGEITAPVYSLAPRLPKVGKLPEEAVYRDY